MENNFSKKLKFEKLPTTSGVYFFYNKKEIIYIGKAINIKNRVKNHFFQPTYKDNIFINTVDRIKCIETSSEISALILEASLIKKHQPKFNVIWKDDKNYFFVAIDKNKQNIPYIYITHQKNSKKAKYIGPFVEGTALKNVLRFLRKVFPFYSFTKHSKLKCTYCHLDLCPGPNLNIIEYRKNIKKLVLVLEGKSKTVLKNLKKEMALYSMNHDFEKAGQIKNKIYNLEKIMSHNTKSLIQGSDPFQIKEEAFEKIIGYNKPIHRIECYDISNIQGKFATGSMVVFINGAPEKSQYKKFRIKMKNEPNDIAMLKEVLSRRLLHSEWPKPDVILIDGGKAQLNVAINTVASQNKNIKIISIAKGRQELFIDNQKEPIALKNLPQKAYNLIKNLDDQAHNFAITYHRKLHKKSLFNQ